MKKNCENHPIADIFPMMCELELKSLAEDIRVNGVLQCGTLYEGKILDGRNRYAAAKLVDAEMSFGDCSLSEPEDQAKFDPVAFVLSENLRRRHLHQSQRALVAAKMANLKVGSNQHKKEGPSNEGPTSTEKASTLLNVSVATVERAKHVLAHGSKALIDAVEAMQVTISMADKLCKACKDKKEQTALVKEGKKAIKEYLTPMPDESDLDVESDEEHDYDYPIVKAFSHADYRLNTMRKLLETLSVEEKNQLGIKVVKAKTT